MSAQAQVQNCTYVKQKLSGFLMGYALFFLKNKVETFICPYSVPYTSDHFLKLSFQGKSSLPNFYFCFYVSGIINKTELASLFKKIIYLSVLRQ